MVSNIVQEIYDAYPRKEGPRYAKACIEKALRRLPKELNWQGTEEDLWQWLLYRVQKYAQSPAGNRGRLTPHPSTWFNQSRYLDDDANWELLSDKEFERLQMQMNANVGIWRPQ